VQAADSLHDLFVGEAVGGQRGEQPLLDDGPIDAAGIQLDRGQVALLGDQHGAARLTLAVLDDPLQGGRFGGAVVGLETLGETGRPRVRRSASPYG
jgi:hypothetical protein